jgi:hypothetical protein
MHFALYRAADEARIDVLDRVQEPLRLCGPHAGPRLFGPAVVPAA